MATEVLFLHESCLPEIPECLLPMLAAAFMLSNMGFPRQEMDNHLSNHDVQVYSLLTTIQSGLLDLFFCD